MVKCCSLFPCQNCKQALVQATETAFVTFLCLHVKEITASPDFLSSADLKPLPSLQERGKADYVRYILFRGYKICRVVSTSGKTEILSGDLGI